MVGVCPEVAGGLSVPRPPAECAGGDGDCVLGGTATVVTRDGVNVTDALVAGAEHAAAVARNQGIRVAVLKSRSPSCAAQEIYDGSFSGHLVPGAGVTAALLKRAGVQVFDETHLEDANAALIELDRTSST